MGMDGNRVVPKMGIGIRCWTGNGNGMEMGIIPWKWEGWGTTIVIPGCGSGPDAPRKTICEALLYKQPKTTVCICSVFRDNDLRLLLFTTVSVWMNRDPVDCCWITYSLLDKRKTAFLKLYCKSNRKTLFPFAPFQRQGISDVRATKLCLITKLFISLLPMLLRVFK